MVMTKRKEFDQVNDDFSDFSLSSPATKIRRLDAELAPIMEEEESQSHTPDFHFPVFPTNYSPATTSVVEPPQSVSAAAAAADELLENQERAIVLFNNPTTTIDINYPPQFSLTSHILSGLKNGNHHLWSKPSLKQQSSSQEHHVNNNYYSSNQCLAVVPWVDSRLPQNAQQVCEDSYDDDDDHHHPQIMMEQEEDEADENEVASMDIEEEEQQVEDNGGYVDIEQIPFAGFHQWQPQQQHCMVVSSSQLQNSTPPTTTTTPTSPPPPPPFVWFQT